MMMCVKNVHIRPVTILNVLLLISVSWCVASAEAETEVSGDSLGYKREIREPAVERNYSIVNVAGDEFWDDRFDENGLDGLVYDIKADHSGLYVGGRFQHAGNTMARYIARWDGNKWSSLGSGTNGVIIGIAIESGYVYTVGFFTEAGGVPANNIAMWDGTNWHALGAGTDGYITAVAVQDSIVYVGGRFTSAGGKSANNIARWDGHHWSSLGTGTNDVARILTIIESNLYVAGVFTKAGGVDANHVAVWDGSKWSALGEGVDGKVFSITGSAVNNIYVGGEFHVAGGVSAGHIARWDGMSWHAMDGGVGGSYVYDMAFKGEKLYVGGQFDAAGDKDVNNITMWDGTYWYVLGNGIQGGDNRVNAICGFGDEIYTGGDFSMAGGKPSRNFARWRYIESTRYRGMVTLGYEHFQQSRGGSQGGSWADYDNDGDPDLFVPNAGGKNNFLYEHNGNACLVEIASDPVTTDGGRSMAGTWGDFDNNGYPDLYVANRSGENNFLYKNLGGGTFEKVTDMAPVTDGGNSYGASWIDYDNDGHLDLFVANRDENNALYHNLGDGTFEKITGGSIVTDGGSSVCGVWADTDGDGDADLYVANAGYEANFYYINNGDGTFTRDLSDPVSTAVGETCSASWGDYNNDGYPDLVCANSGQANGLFQNNGDGSFTRMRNEVIISINDHSRGSCWGDFDKDGDLDLFVSNRNEDCFIYLYNRDFGFSAYTMDNITGRGCSWCDFDEDGHLNLFVAQEGSFNYLYDCTGNKNNWIQITCKGTISNKSAIGAKIRVKATIDGIPVWQMREISSQTGFSAQNDMTITFGLMYDNVADSIRIEWPSGIVWDATDVPANQHMMIVESASNQVPAAADDHVTVMMNTATLLHLLGNDNDPDGDALTITSINTIATLGLTILNSGDTTVTYIPPAGYTGSDQFRYTVSDGRGGTDTATVHIDITAGNRNPEAVDDMVQIAAGEIRSINCLSNDSDPDGDPLRINALITGATTGISLVNSGDTTVTYIPPSGYEGCDQFGYIVGDGRGGLDTGLVVIQVGPATSVYEESRVPASFALHQNHPNPFNPETTIRYDLPEHVTVKLIVYDMLGNEIITLVNNHQEAGYHSVIWDGRSAAGMMMPSGIYIIRIVTKTFVKSHKMLLVR